MRIPDASINKRPDRMPRKRYNLPVKVRCGELSIHPASKDPVLRGNWTVIEGKPYTGTKLGTADTAKGWPKDG